MFKWLRNVFLGRSANNRGGPSGDFAREEGCLGEGAGKKYILLSRRLSQPRESMPGFPEAYYCTKCQDYFVLAWHLQSSSFVEQSEVVQDTHPALQQKSSGPLGVFCPECNSDYGMYGLIPHPETPVDQPEDLRVYEALDYPFPPDAPSTAQKGIGIGGVVIEKIVLLITGEFPDEMNVRDFAYSGFSDVVLARLGGELKVTDGGIHLHVFRTNTIVDETPWLTAFVQKEVYQSTTLGTKLFTTHGIMELKPPLRQALFCLIHRTE